MYRHGRASHGGKQTIISSSGEVKDVLEKVVATHCAKPDHVAGIVCKYVQLFDNIITANQQLRCSVRVQIEEGNPV